MTEAKLVWSQRGQDHLASCELPREDCVVCKMVFALDKWQKEKTWNIIERSLS